MKKIMKKIMVIVLAVSLCVGTFMTTHWNTALAEEASADGLKVIGASIRFINEDTAVDGIRFAVGIKADAMNGLTSEQKQNYHLLVMPTALLTDGELTQGETYEYTVNGETRYARAQDILIDWANATDETVGGVAYKVVRIYLNQIDANHYTTDVTARAYYQDGSDAPIYSDAIERSYCYVANAALNDDISTYNPTQRDALLGVKYEKTGTWDYVDGKLVTNGSTKTEAGTSIHPMLLDRNVGTSSSNYVIETSFNVNVSDDTVYVGKADNTDASMKGFVFAYDETTKGYYILDFRYRAPAGLQEGWYPYIRYYNGSGWGTTIGKGSPIDAGWSDFRIAVDATGDTTEISVEYKKQGEKIYTTIINSRSVGTDSWADGTKINGSKVGFYSTLADQTLEFSPEIKISDNTVQTRGNSTVKLDQKLNDDGTGTIEGSFVYDYRNCKSDCANVRREGIVLGDASGNGYFFCICVHMPQNAFFISLKKGSTSNGSWGDVVSGAGFNELPKLSLAADLKLEDNDEILVKYKIIVTKNESNQNVFTIDYSLNYGDTVIYEKTNWKCVDTNAAQTTITTIYLRSEDSGSPEKNVAINDHVCGNGQTIYYPVTVNGIVAQPGEPESGGGDTITTTKIQNQGTLTVDKVLNITTEATTIEGAFVYDYRSCNADCANVRREGIVLGDASGTGYFFCICAHMPQKAFFISLKKGSTSNGSWGDVISGAGFNELPKLSLAEEAGLKLEDNDEILVKYKIVIAKNESNQNVFTIDYSLNYGDTVIYEKTNWKCVDTNATQTTITTLYLRSEDGGSPEKNGVINNHVCGDGQTIYYPITINGEKVNVK